MTEHPDIAAPAQVTAPPFGVDEALDWPSVEERLDSRLPGDFESGLPPGCAHSRCHVQGQDVDVVLGGPSSRASAGRSTGSPPPRASPGESPPRPAREAGTTSP